MNHGNRIYEYYQNEVLKEMEEDIETKIKKLCAPPKTNFSKITESVESLARFIDVVTFCCAKELCETCPIKKQKGVGCYKHTIKEWLQQEVADETL